MNKQTEEFMSIKNPQTLSAWTEVGKPHPHESAILHVTGEATYTDDILELQGTLHAALGLSAKAHARLRAIDLSKVKASVGVVAVYTADDIPGENQCGAIIKDDPVLADGLVQYVGQPIFVVIADSHDNARRAARQAVIDYEELPSILTPRAAHAAESYVLPPMHLTRGNPARPSKRRRPNPKASSTSAARNSFTWKARSRTRFPRKVAACMCIARPSIRAKCNTTSPKCCISLRMTCWSNAGAWAAASAARNRNRPCGLVPQRSLRCACAVRSSCAPTAMTT